MSQQYNKVIKRRRRLRYQKRKNLAAKTRTPKATAAKPKAPASQPAPA